MQFELQVECESEAEAMKLIVSNLEATVGCGRCISRNKAHRGWNDNQYMEVIDYNFDVADLEIELDDEEPLDKPEWLICGNCNGAGSDRIGKCSACGGLGEVRSS
ncbi:MAG: hypothetical protein ACWGQW_02725 [bacterium]